MKATAPATTANFGPGFDAIGLAFRELRASVTVQPNDEFVLTSTGEGSGLPTDESHLAAKVVKAVTGHGNHRIHVQSDIPTTRGLGSSSAVALAAAAAAGATDPLAVAYWFEGHADNCSAAMHGGLVSTAAIDGRISAMSHRLDPSLRFVVLVPDKLLATADARAALPDSIPHVDAVFNVGRAMMLLRGLADASKLVPAAADDRLHQPYRESIFPESTELIHAMVRGGARMACWSGAGSTMLGVCQGLDEARRVRDAGQEAMAKLEVSGRTAVLTPDFGGLVVEHLATANPFDAPTVGYEPLTNRPRQLESFMVEDAWTN